MWRYFSRRLLQTIPTVCGVVLLNFILFNIVGESPGLMVLGNKASPESLEEFDEARGFNKPLLWGRRAPTRLYDTVDFREGIGSWGEFSNARHDAATRALVLEAGDAVAPLAFAPWAGIAYEWKMDYRIEPGSQVEFFGLRLESTEWTTIRVPITGGVPLEIKVDEGRLLIRRLELTRLVESPFDSQLAFYVGQLFRGDLGRSETLKQPVASLLKAGILPSLALTVPIFFIGVVVAVSLSLVCAFFRNTLTDRLIVVVSVALMSINYLVFIVAGQFVLAFKLGWFPVWGFESARYLVLPVIIASSAVSAPTSDSIAP